MSEDADKKVDDQKDESTDRNYEAEARKEGWVGADEWVAKGKDPSLHKSAEEFVKAGERIVPILKSRLTKLEKKYEGLREERDRERKATLAAMKDQNDIHQSRLKEALKDAVTKGDGEKVVELQDKLGEAKDAAAEIKRELQAKPQTQEDPAFVAFLEENSWYSTDEDLAAEADALGARYFRAAEKTAPRDNQGRPIVDLDGVFSKVAKEIKRLNPDKFGRKPASPDSPNRGGNGGESKSKGVSKEVRAQFEKMSQYVPSADRAKFVENAIANYQANQQE